MGKKPPLHVTEAPDVGFRVRRRRAERAEALRRQTHAFPAPLLLVAAVRERLDVPTALGGTVSVLLSSTGRRSRKRPFSRLPCARLCPRRSIIDPCAFTWSRPLLSAARRRGPVRQGCTCKHPWALVYDTLPQLESRCKRQLLQVANMGAATVQRGTVLLQRLEPPAGHAARQLRLRARSRTHMDYNGLPPAYSGRCCGQWRQHFLRYRRRGDCIRVRVSAPRAAIPLSQSCLMAPCCVPPLRRPIITLPQALIPLTPASVLRWLLLRPPTGILLAPRCGPGTAPSTSASEVSAATQAGFSAAGAGSQGRQTGLT